MSSVGPQLPPHLSKRKREDDEPPSSPPRKVQAAEDPEKRVLGPAPPPSANPNELDIEGSSDDEYGPSNPISNPTASSKKVVGPTLPPCIAIPSSATSFNPAEINVGDSSGDDHGSSNSKLTANPPAKRVLGPAPPPASLSELPSHPANDSSSESDDDYGPALPPAPGSHAEQEHLQALVLEREREAQESNDSKKPKRDEWMLLPPTEGTSRADPTKLKSRKFASGKGSRAPVEKGGGISALWTETPEQKRKRLEDEVLGRSEVTLNSSSKPKNKGGKVESAEDKATAKRIAEYNARNRGESLMEKRKREGGQKEEDDDPSARAFDREKDMALGGLGRMEKRDMVRKAGEFGERFAKGSYL